MTAGTAEAAYSFYCAGRDALRSGDRSAAIEQLQRASQMSPHSKTYELLGECLLDTGRGVDAILYLSAAIALGGRQSRPRFLLARALLQLGSTWKADAAGHLREALRINPNYQAARDLLSTVAGQDDALARK